MDIFSLKGGAPGHEVIRAMTLILKDQGQSRAEVASVLDITPRTVTNTCNNYCEFGLDRSRTTLVQDNLLYSMIALNRRL